VVDGHRRIIVAASVEQSASDARALVPMVEQAKRNVGQGAKEILADAGGSSVFEGSRRSAASSTWSAWP